MTAEKSYCIIDIGTVTCRCLLARVRDGHLSELYRGHAITNLGKGVDATGLLCEESMDAVADAVRGFLEARDETFAREDVTTVVIATSASRDAKNAQEFAVRLQALGVEPRIISGQQEGRLSFVGATMDFDECVMVVDSGGGSTEIIVGKAGANPLFTRSVDVGCRRITERFLRTDPPTTRELQEATHSIDEVLAPVIVEALTQVEAAGMQIQRMVAVAGTATSAVSMREHMVVYDRKAVHRQQVSLADLEALVQRLASLPLEKRKQVVGLEPARASVITGGLLILREVVALSGLSGYTVSETDLMHGACLADANF